MTIIILQGIANLKDNVLIYHCISNYRSQSCKPEPSSHQQQQAALIYEQVSVEKLELRENVAYRPVQSIELKTNDAYGHMQH